MTNALTTSTPTLEVSDETEEVFQLVSFQLGQEEFAIDILGVQEIIRMADITAVPNAPHYVEGVINLRGKVIPIINLRARFGLPLVDPTKDTRIIVVEVGSLILGFVVDSVEEVLRIPEELIEPPPVSGRMGSEEFHRGIGRIEGRLLILLDLTQLFRVTKGH